MNSNKDDASAACNDYLKVLGYTALAFAWIKTTFQTQIRKVFKNMRMHAHACKPICQSP